MAGTGRGAAAELWGVLLPPRRAAEGSEDEEDEEVEEEPHLAEAALLEASGRDLTAALPPRRAAVIQESSKKEYEVVGRFPLVGPWWTVNVKVKKGGSKYFVQGYPSYFLRTDIEDNNREIFSLFLKECGVPEYFKKLFFAWLPAKSTLSFGNLEEKLKQFQVSHLSTGKKQGDTKDFNISYYVWKSVAGKAVLVALTYPMILEFLPTLLPRHFCSLLDTVCWQRKTESADTDGETVHFEDEILTKLDEILKNEPWKLGFSRITYRELKLSYCEATWDAFRQCEHLLWKIPDLQKNALILYNKLKKHCREMGHTYENQDELTRFVSEDMSIESAWQSLEFLKDENIVIREKTLVFLPHLYKSEKDIAMYIGDLLSKCSWQLDVDARKILTASEMSREVVDSKTNGIQAQEVEHLKEDNPHNHHCENQFPEREVASTSGTQSKAEVDPDQVIAIEKICSNPVTIISGKGGCGKSTIVSCLFRHLKQIEKEVEAASKDFEEDLDVSEEWDTFDRHWESENTCTKNPLNVLFTAPTGRAASLLSEKTNLPAYTLHQIIYSFKSWRQTEKEVPWKFSTVTVLIVDEGSLVSVHILSLVLKILCEHAQLAKLIILDLQAAIKALLKEGPGLQDATQSQFIAFRRQDCDLINELCCQHYSNHLTRDHKRRLLFQVDDKISCTRNMYLKDLLPDPGIGRDPEQHKCRNGETTLSTENTEEGKRLCNGDIFFITRDVEINKQRLLTISSTYGSTYTVNYKALKKLCHIKHAWARTIHTFQGSEEKTVVYVVGNPGRQHWQHVYTAVTRGRCRVYVIAEEMHLRKAVTNNNFPRKTRLQRFLREAIANTNSCLTQTSSPLTKSWPGQERGTQPVSLTRDVPDPSQPGTDRIQQEGSADLNKEHTGHLQQISPYKRQQSHAEDSENPLGKDSPLGTARLRSLTLEQVTPRKLFKS
ncbi:DNA helicase B isoform X2 [Gallus gallus]|uniref:DNA helicase B isoform X2 n=1 Tax=Gallus gallus TaxID=9031 RepID=UPI001AE2BCB2|nr:DNA helicase B isoform X2 [Gallus gallus]